MRATEVLLYFQGNEVIKYLEYCVNDLHNHDQAIHNYLLSLYAKLQPDKLMGYLEDQDKVGYYWSIISFHTSGKVGRTG